MTARIFNLALERRCRALDKALARAEAEADRVRTGVVILEADLAQLSERIEYAGVDKRAAECLATLKCYFADCPVLVAELDHLKSLLKAPGRIIH